MELNSTITRIEILKLFGRDDLNINIQNNVLILIAENGSGKSTILRMVYYFLSKQWSKLLVFDFEKISVWINNTKVEFNKKKFLIEERTNLDIEPLILKYPLYSKAIKDISNTYDINELQRNQFLQKTVEAIFDIPISLVYELVEQMSRSTSKMIDFDLDFCVIYLPTFRRIESTFEALFPDLSEEFAGMLKGTFPMITEAILNEKEQSEDKKSSETELDTKRFITDFWRNLDYERWKRRNSELNYLELIEFGMNDVEFKLSNILKEIKENLGETRDNLQHTMLKFINLCNSYLISNKVIEYESQSNKISITLADSNQSLSL